jgi:hypothetical protein
MKSAVAQDRTLEEVGLEAFSFNCHHTEATLVTVCVCVAVLHQLPKAAGVKGVVTNGLD